MRHCLRILLVVASIGTLVEPCGASLQSDTPDSRLARICTYLETGTPNQAAAARRQLWEEIGSEETESLRSFLAEHHYPTAARLLRERLGELLSDRIRNVEDRIEFFDEARRLSREHAATLADLIAAAPGVAKDDATPQPPAPAADDPAESPGDKPDENAAGDTIPADDPEAAISEARERLLLQRRARDDARREIHDSHQFLLRQGLALAPVLFHRRESGGVSSPQIRRFHGQLERHLLDLAQARHPAAPDAESLSDFECRSLTPLLEELTAGAETNAGWQRFRETVATRAMALFASYAPGDVEEARRVFLELGEWGVQRLDRWVAADDEHVPVEIRRLYAEWNRLGASPELVERTALPIGTYRTAPLPRRLQLVYRLEWVGQELAIPVFSRLLRLEPNLTLRVEVAAALARLDDPRGGEFLRQLGLQNALILEGVSRQVLLIEAIHRRETGDLDGAIADLLTMTRRFPGDARVHYELAYAALLAKRYDLSIEHFKRSIAVEPREHLAHYNLACAYALSGASEEAIEELRLAIETGFSDPTHMAQDPDLTSLRERTDFKELLAELSAANR
ncbi:MAG: tetratricopeptide repeat protein [Planctomycetota bacterium]